LTQEFQEVSVSEIAISSAEVPAGREQLRRLLSVIPIKLFAIGEHQASFKPAPDQWSRKQELGHLIDSAANNHQRIVRGQLQNNPTMPDYDGDKWVELHNYQNRAWTELIELWRRGNEQLLTAADAAPDSAWSRTLSVGGNQMTLTFLLDDYVRHLADHLVHMGVGANLDDLAESSVESLYPEKPAPAEQAINGLMRRRWSPRAFDESRPVERAKILALLEAVRWAPSCFNDQPRFFLVFDGSDAEALEKARSCLVSGNAWATRAPVLMLSVARETFKYNGKPNRHGQHDTGLATENLLLQAVELGLAAHAMAGFDADRAKAEFGVPDGFTLMAMIAIGYPYHGKLEEIDENLRAKELAPRGRSAMGETAFAGQWGEPF
jgi:nitroreductase